jgi:hypothetical protein
MKNERICIRLYVEFILLFFFDILTANVAVCINENCVYLMSSYNFFFGRLMFNSVQLNENESEISVRVTFFF